MDHNLLYRLLYSSLWSMRQSYRCPTQVVKLSDRFSESKQTTLMVELVLNNMEIIDSIVTDGLEVEGKVSNMGQNLETDKTKAEFVWTLQATWHLVHIRLEMDQLFDQPVCKKKKLWELVSEKINAKLSESADSEVSAKAYECDLKWRNMLATYRKNAERARRLGEGSVHWEFFKAMHEVLGKSREEVEAQRRARLCGTKLGKAIASKRFTPILPTPSAGGGPRPPQDVLQLYMELQERKMNMWAQQKALEERKIEAINNLAQAISSLAQKNGDPFVKEGP
ncbi:uncharacterized protein si:dkey-66i24.7 [Gadus macrocephalus]|uniref:uncharacterized protein si:dkey-66i24.7 n=1 Tax=Gadus macrocephalus TaxID=80720 RepID=UPI0028CBA482|nr:uncharacterized protein si:dkey-66i24.7 [Gadus macrocephalus]